MAPISQANTTEAYQVANVARTEREEILKGEQQLRIELTDLRMELEALTQRLRMSESQLRDTRDGMTKAHVEKEQAVVSDYANVKSIIRTS